MHAVDKKNSRNRSTFVRLLKARTPFKVIAVKKVLRELQEIAIKCGVLSKVAPGAAGLYFRTSPEVVSGWVNSRGMSWLKNLEVPEYDPDIDSLKSSMWYNKRVWLNHSGSSSTSTMVCYSGEANWLEENSNKRALSRFVEIADCHNKVRIHQAPFENINEFIDKIKLMQETLAAYRELLEIERDNIEKGVLASNEFPL